MRIKGLQIAFIALLCTANSSAAFGQTISLEDPLAQLQQQLLQQSGEENEETQAVQPLPEAGATTTLEQTVEITAPANAIEPSLEAEITTNVIAAPVAGQAFAGTNFLKNPPFSSVMRPVTEFGARFGLSPLTSLIALLGFALLSLLALLRAFMAPFYKRSDADLQDEAYDEDEVFDDAYAYEDSYDEEFDDDTTPKAVRRRPNLSRLKQSIRSGWPRHTRAEHDFDAQRFEENLEAQGGFETEYDNEGDYTYAQDVNVDANVAEYASQNFDQQDFERTGLFETEQYEESRFEPTLEGSEDLFAQSSERKANDSIQVEQMYAEQKRSSDLGDVVDRLSAMKRRKASNIHGNPTSEMGQALEEAGFDMQDDRLSDVLELIDEHQEGTVLGAISDIEEDYTDSVNRPRKRTVGHILRNRDTGQKQGFVTP